MFWDDRFDGRTADAAVAAMVDALGHRGPDGRGQYAPPPSLDTAGSMRVVLGHTRLAILDLSEAGAQPMNGRCGTPSLTYNGEIYNFRALRDELEQGGCRFGSQSDTEVVLRAYETWGVDCLRRLRGMFAFGVWDARLRRLMLARDRLGIKPLYYYVGDGLLVFASEVRALLASGLVPRRLDPVGLDHYLAYQAVPAPRTLVEGVCVLPPGHHLLVDAHGGISVTQYWDLLASASPEAREASPVEAGERVRGLLRDATLLHLVSDVPVGVFLSGGIDSSALVSLLREAGVTPRTFSVAFADTAYDEAPYARLVADRFRTDHVEIRVDDREIAARMPDVLAGVDQPSGDGVNTAVVSRAVRAEGLKVALSGLGGDEIFGGYPSFARMRRFMRWSSLWGRTPGSVRGLAAAVVEGLGGSAAGAKAGDVLRGDGTLAQAFPITRQLFRASERRRLLAPLAGARRASSLDDDPYVTLLAEAFAREGAGRDVGSLVSYGEARTYMHDVLLRDADQMSMACGLEVRVPLLDHELVEYVMGLPDEVKFQGATPKSLLTRSLGLRLPDAVVDRPKRGFVLPFDPWMRGSLRSYCEDRLVGRDGLGGRGLLDRDAVGGLWQAFLAGDRRVTWSRPWALVALGAWLDRHDLST